MVFLKNALMCIKKVILINDDCQPILMQLSVMLAYLMLSAALSNTDCLHNAYFLLLILANAFCFNALSWFIDTYFVYFKYEIASCTVLLICRVFLILCSHSCFFAERAMRSLEI